ncbi:MAG: response regulator [Ruminiclostridium sp.]|jgi:two-component system alkaline phosphatase synthesis response regulator PhoP|nr:response regulator [Ruminiclostridium sp.]
MILCVEDDQAIRELMLYALRGAGYEAKGCADSAALFAVLETESPELILLDIMLPGEDGLSILNRLRTNPVMAEIPVIMATAKGTEYDKVTGLDLGADDYLSKPFGMMEMISRIKAVLRRTQPKTIPLVLRLKDLEVDREAHTVLAAGEQVELTLKEFQLLCTFLEHPGRVFSRDQLLAAVWGGGYTGETRTVDVHIATLRTKLKHCGGYVETVRGVGYRMGSKL